LEYAQHEGFGALVELTKPEKLNICIRSVNALQRGRKHPRQTLDTFSTGCNSESF